MRGGFLHHNKAQITLFVIIGLILLITVSLLLFVRQSAIQKQLDYQASQAVSGFVETTALNQYVKGCLDLVASDGLLLLGEQGGVIFESQGGMTPSEGNFIEGKDYIPNTFFRQERGENGTLQYDKVDRNVSYAVTARTDCPQFTGPFLANIFDNDYFSYYPVKETYFKDYIKQFRKHYTNGGCYGYYEKPSVAMSGFIGGNHFPKLCSYNGSNAFDPFSRIQPCQPQEYDSKFEPRSIQRQLETYIKNNLGKCVNLTNYERYSGTPIHINEDNVKISTIFEQPRGLIVKAEYPLTVEVNEHNIAQTTSFEIELDTNIRKLYRYISKLIVDYVRDPTFRLDTMWNDTTKNRYYENNFQMFYYAPSCINCQFSATQQDHLLTVIDHSSMLKGRPWAITVGIKQRDPILNYLHDEGLSSEFNGEKIDYQFFANSTAELEPEGFDPDGENITYIYKGWKEDYDETINWTKCSADPNCNFTTIQNYMNRTNSSPQLWTQSTEFQNTKQKAQINTSFNDVGLHNVTIIIKDSNGRTDFQIVRVLVFDLPIARINGSNTYDDINNDWASVEDSYIINASKSTASMLAGGTINGYYYADLYPNGFTTNSNQSILLLSPEYWNATLDYFKKNNFDIANESNTHDITVFVRQNDSGIPIQSTTAHKEVHVAQCLPHLYNQTGTSPFDPLTDFSEEYDASKGFNTAHVCCEPLEHSTTGELTGGKIVTSSEGLPCRKRTFFITRPDLTKPYPTLNKSIIDVEDQQSGKIWSTNFSLGTYQGTYQGNIQFYYSQLSQSPQYKSELMNDYYKVNFKQKCSGLRGNTCGGNFYISWDQHSCNDYPIEDQFARCQAPKKTSGTHFLKPLTNTEYNEALFCANFSAGESFEKTVLDIGGTNAPQTNEWSSSPHNQEQLIQDGYCAPQRPAKINNQGAISIDNEPGSAYLTSGTIPYPFICQARCNPSKGECDYWELNQCEINLPSYLPESSCNGVNGSDFDFVHHKIYVCHYFSSQTENKLVACDNEANVYDADQGGPQFCYCRTKVVSASPFSETDAQNNDKYFANPGGDDCCVAGVTIVLGTGDKVCIEGVVKHNNVIFSNSHLLSHGGSVYCCEDSNGDGCSNFAYTINTASGGTVSGISCSNGVWSN